MTKRLLTGLTLGAALFAATAAQADIVVGVAGPITGPNAAFGKQLTDGAEAAAAAINAAGGINGEKVVIEKADDRSEEKEAPTVANLLVSKGAKFVVGHFNSSLSIPASEIYAENGIMQITPASTNPTFTERGLWNVFRTCGRDDQQGAVAGEYIATKLAGKKIAVVHDKTTYGQGLADETKKALNGRGVTEVLYEGIDREEKDYSALISKLKQAGVDYLYFGGLHTEAGKLIRQMRDQGLSTVLISGDGIVSNEFWSIAGPGAEGTLMTFSSDPRKRPSAAKVVEEFKAKGIDPEGYVLYSYAAMQIFAQAAAGAKSTDPVKVAEYARTGVEFDTVLGKIAFDSKGDVKVSDYVFYVWSNGSYKEL